MGRAAAKVAGPRKVQMADGQSKAVVIIRTHGTLSTG